MKRSTERILTTHTGSLPRPPDLAAVLLGSDGSGPESEHVRARVRIAEAGPVEAVMWSGASRSQELIGARHVDLLGVLETNVWNGASRVQMRLSDFRRGID